MEWSHLLLLHRDAAKLLPYFRECEMQCLPTGRACYYIFTQPADWEQGVLLSEN